MVTKEKIVKVNTLTNILYVFAKFQFAPDEACISKIKKQFVTKEDELNTRLVSRNLWNFFELKIYDKQLFDTLCKVISGSSTDSKSKIQHNDIANSL